MRAYYFGNMYLSSIQQGIQAAHVTAEMLLKYVTITEDYEVTANPKRIMAWQWARDHKTMVLLNGGYGETIRNLIEFFDDIENPYPWAEFYEGEDALDGALTDVGIILPEKIYAGSSELRSNPAAPQLLLEEGCLGLFTGTPEARTEEYSRWEAQLMGKLNTFGLAK